MDHSNKSSSYRVNIYSNLIVNHHKGSNLYVFELHFIFFSLHVDSLVQDQLASRLVTPPVLQDEFKIIIVIFKRHPSQGGVVEQIGGPF